MRSRLEAAWAEQFDAFGWDWRYEPEVFAAPHAGQYLPDFIVWPMGDPLSSCYIEVKPASWFQRPRGEVKADMRRWVGAMRPNTAAPLIVATVAQRQAMFFGMDASLDPVLVELVERAGIVVLDRIMCATYLPTSPTTRRPIGSLWADSFARPAVRA